MPMEEWESFGSNCCHAMKEQHIVAEYKSWIVDKAEAWQTRW